MDDSPLLRLPRTAATHFTLYLHAAIVAVITRVVREHDSAEAAFERFPFLAGYVNQLARHGLDGVPMGESVHAWRGVLERWEEGIDGHLPLRALREAYGLTGETMEAFMSLGLVDEDARFAEILNAPGNTTTEVRALWRELEEVGLVQLRNRAPHVADALWAVVSGEAREAIAPWARYCAPAGLRELDRMVVPSATMAFAQRLPDLLRESARTFVVRGPRHNGRGTLAGAIARSMNRGLLRIDWPAPGGEERERVIGPLCVALHAMPFITLDPAPGETITLPDLPGLAGPLAIALGTQGGVAGPVADGALTLKLELPGEEARARLWKGTGCDFAEGASAVLANRHRLGSGTIHRVARTAKTHAALDGRRTIEPRDVETVLSGLHREALDTLAVAIPARGRWSDLVVDERTAAELALLETRCRHRERLPALVGESLGAHVNPGVRILLKGPSGTGKSACARTLAAALEKSEIYRIDLAAVTSKYIGETERNLNRVFDRAEELDVMLLLDEGEGMLGRRTTVNSSNDRHSNDLTNFVLQKLETYTGVLVVTTNEPDLVDSAFRRRFDVVIELGMPEAVERLAIFNLHLPPRHAVDPGFLEEVAYRCALSGGQIRNVVLHACLTALDRARDPGTDDLEAAVQREYSKAGAVCPLRARHAAMTATG